MKKSIAKSVFANALKKIMHFFNSIQKISKKNDSDLYTVIFKKKKRDLTLFTIKVYKRIKTSPFSLDVFGYFGIALE